MQQCKQPLQIFSHFFCLLPVGSQIICAEVDDKIFRLHTVENTAKKEVFPVVSRRASDPEFQSVFFPRVRRVEVAPISLGVIEERIAEEYRSGAAVSVRRIARLYIGCLLRVRRRVPLARSASVYTRTDHIESCRIASARYFNFKRSLGERFYGFSFFVDRKFGSIVFERIIALPVVEFQRKFRRGIVDPCVYVADNNIFNFHSRKYGYDRRIAVKK